MIFRALLIALFGFGALTATVHAEDSSSCTSASAGAIYCTCDDGATSLSPDADDAESCNEACYDAVGGGTWLLEECRYDGTTESVDQGNTEAPATSTNETETKADPILPDLIVDIPGIEDFAVEEESGYVKPNFLGVYVAAVYKWLIGACALVAVVMIMIGGLQYAMARGKSEYIEKAKKRIANAVIGLVLLLAAYNIAFLINPDLVVFSSLAVRQVPEIPTDNFVEPDSEDAVEAAATGNFYGQSKWQDCMLGTFGANKAEVESHMRTVSYQGKSVQLHKLVADDFQAAFDEISAAGIDYTMTSIGGYDWRANRNNLNALSFHAWGVAIDINPETNPNCTTGSCEYDMPEEIVNIFAKHNIGWGGNWKSVKDYMHFSTKLYCGGSR